MQEPFTHAMSMLLQDSQATLNSLLASEAAQVAERAARAAKASSLKAQRRSRNKKSKQQQRQREAGLGHVAAASAPLHGLAPYSCLHEDEELLLLLQSQPEAAQHVGGAVAAPHTPMPGAGAGDGSGAGCSHWPGGGAGLAAVAGGWQQGTLVAPGLGGVLPWLSHDLARLTSQVGAARKAGH